MCANDVWWVGGCSFYLLSISVEQLVCVYPVVEIFNDAVLFICVVDAVGWLSALKRTSSAAFDSISVSAVPVYICDGILVRCQFLFASKNLFIGWWFNMCIYYSDLIVR